MYFRQQKCLPCLLNNKKMKIQTNVNQRKQIQNNFLSEVSHTIKIQNFDHQNWSDFFVKEPIFPCQAEHVLIFLGIFKCQISACRFLYH